MTMKPGSPKDKAMEKAMGIKPGSAADKAMEKGKPAFKGAATPFKKGR